MARDKYNSKAYEDLRVRVPKGRKADIQAHASNVCDESLNGFINRAIDEAIQRDRRLMFDRHGVNAIGKVSPEAKELMLLGKSGMTTKEIHELRNLTPAELRAIAEKIILDNKTHPDTII